MRQLRYFFRLTVAFSNRFKGVFFLSVIFGVAIFLSLRFVSPQLLVGGGEVIGVAGKYHLDSLPYFITSEISSGLTKVDDSGEATPDLVENWEVKRGGRRWIFNLRSNLKWQDGKELVAKDLKYSFEDVDVSYIDDSTIVFDLNHEFSPFLNVLSEPVFRKGLLGTGEWKVVKLSLAGTYVDKVVLQDTNKNRKTYKFYSTQEGLKLAYKLGEVDSLVDLVDPKPFDGWSTAKVEEEIKLSRYVGIFFNSQDPVLSDKTFRQALTYSINKENFAGPRAYGPLNPNSWAYNPQVKDYEYSPDRARELLDELDDKLVEEANINLATTPALLSVAEHIAEEWSAVGIKTTVQVVSILPEEYEAFLAIYDIPEDPDQYASWHSTQMATNISKYQNPRIDKLLEDGRTEINKDERRKIYLDFQRFLLEDAPVAFLYHPVSYRVSRR